MENSNNGINVTCCFSKILVTLIFTMLWAELNMAGVRDQYVFCLNYSTLLHTVCFSMLKTQEHCCLCFKPLVHYYEYYDVLLIKIRNHKLYSIQHLPQSDALKRCVQKSFYTPKHFDSAILVTLQQWHHLCLAKISTCAQTITNQSSPNVRRLRTTSGWQC